MDELEKYALDTLRQAENGGNDPSYVFAASTAISMKRIADALEQTNRINEELLKLHQAAAARFAGKA